MNVDAYVVRVDGLSQAQRNIAPVHASRMHNRMIREDWRDDLCVMLASTSWFAIISENERCGEKCTYLQGGEQGAQSQRNRGASKAERIRCESYESHLRRCRCAPERLLMKNYSACSGLKHAGQSTLTSKD